MSTGCQFGQSTMFGRPGNATNQSVDRAHVCGDFRIRGDSLVENLKGLSGGVIDLTSVLAITGIPGVGPTGVVGGQGSTGIRGPMGPAGAVGKQGATGPVGFSSFDTIGPEGPPGVRGPTGVMGPPSATGPTGDTGLQGIAGPKGPAVDNILVYRPGPFASENNQFATWQELFAYYETLEGSVDIIFDDRNGACVVPPKSPSGSWDFRGGVRWRGLCGLGRRVEVRLLNGVQIRGLNGIQENLQITNACFVAPIRLTVGESSQMIISQDCGLINSNANTEGMFLVETGPVLFEFRDRITTRTNGRPIVKVSAGQDTQFNVYEDNILSRDFLQDNPGSPGGTASINFYGSTTSFSTQDLYNGVVTTNFGADARFYGIDPLSIPVPLPSLLGITGPTIQQGIDEVVKYVDPLSGPTGSTGVTGPTGLAGLAGPIGPAGTVRGPTGPTGSGSPLGPTGLAYITMHRTATAFATNYSGFAKTGSVYLQRLGGRVIVQHSEMEIASFPSSIGTFEGFNVPADFQPTTTRRLYGIPVFDSSVNALTSPEDQRTVGFEISSTFRLVVDQNIVGPTGYIQPSSFMYHV